MGNPWTDKFAGDPLPQTDEELFKKQREHLDWVRGNKPWRAIDCLHNKCTECLGTGVKKDGCACAHMISCPCQVTSFIPSQII